MSQSQEITGTEKPPELIITRRINAPRQLVWDAFTQAQHLQHWWGPKGFELIVKSFDLSPGGNFHYQMKSDDGNSMWGLFNYIEIEEPEKIVFTSSFSDEDGNLARAPFFDGGWPMKVLNTWTFKDDDGATILTLHGTPLAATDDEMNTFAGNISSMQQGYGGTFDKLDVYLAKLKV